MLLAKLQWGDKSSARSPHRRIFLLAFEFHSTSSFFNNLIIIPLNTKNPYLNSYKRIKIIIIYNLSIFIK